MASVMHPHLQDIEDGLAPSEALARVQAVYSGPEGRLWERLMGEQIHVGGMLSSETLADRAGIRGQQLGIDLCCCTGAGMRYLTILRNVQKMIGVDATRRMINKGIRRCSRDGVSGCIEFVEADATRTGLPGGEFDFVWSEDAWCYVEDKTALVRESARLVKSGGVIAFTDWICGENPMTESELSGFCGFMKFPNLQSLPGYTMLLEQSGCRIKSAEYTSLFAPAVDSYLNMLHNQFKYDALRLLNFDESYYEGLMQGMHFVQELAHQGKVRQALFVAVKS